MNSVCSAARNQVTILGTNSLFGKVVSFLLKQSPVANRLVLYDEVDIQVAQDIAEIPTQCKVVAYNGEDQLRCAVKNSDVILIGDKGDCLANEDEAIRSKSADIVKYANAISSIAPNAVVLIATTPVNSLLPLFTEAQIGCGTFDSDKVMGVTSADTMRASTLLARHMGMEPEKAYLPVIGGSSAATRIPLFSQSRPTINASKDDLKKLTRGVKMTEDELKRLLNRGEALNKAYATVQLINSVMSALRGQRNISEIVLSRTCLVPNVDYFSLPVILGTRGIAHRFPLPPLTEKESILLDHAVKHIEIDKMKGISALNGECCIPQEPEMTEKYSELITDGCRKDFVQSLMEKFKMGDCPEVCEPRLEYKLLSKVKLKLPPEATPTELPKRTKFIEPDTPPQDGCCPLRLPCPPVPPLRGLNHIQAKHTCKSRGQPKACNCFFPPVEKSLVPCNLCPSNKPCANYGDLKTLYEEHRHCCGLETNTGEDSTCSDLALISAGTTNSHNTIATHQNYVVQPESSNGPNPPITSNGLDTKVLSIGPGEPVKSTAEKPKKTIFQGVWEYPRTDSALNPVPKPASAVAQQSQSTTTNQTYPPGKESSPQIQTSGPNSQQHVSELKNPESSLKAASPPYLVHESNMPTTSTNNQITPQSSIQSGTIQHDDPSWPFKCSTSVCLDVLASQKSGYQTAWDKSIVPGDHESKLSSDQKHAEFQNLRHAGEEIQNPQSALPMEQNKNTNTKPQEQRKLHNCSSALSLAEPQGMIEGIRKDPPGREEIRPLMKDRSTHSGHQEDSIHTTTKHSSASVQGGSHPDSCLFLKVPNYESNAQTESSSSNLKECCNKLAPLPTQNPAGHDFLSTASSNIMRARNIPQDPQIALPMEQKTNTNNQQEQHTIYNYSSGLSLTNLQKVVERSEGKAEIHSVTIKSSSVSLKRIDHREPTDKKALDERHARDENVKRRMYATLNIVEDITSEPKPATSTTNNSTDFSLSQHSNDGFKNSRSSRRIPKTGEPEGSSGNSMLSILRERSNTINANMELQTDLRASLDRSERKWCKDNIGLGDLIDAINPVKRLPKRLESRPALRKAHQGLKKMYEYPKHLGNQGKTASILVKPKPGHEDKSLVVAEDSKDSKKLSSRIDQLKERIQEALTKIIFPAETPSEIKPTEKSSKHQQRLSHNKLVKRPAMRKISKAKQDFFVQMRKTDPAYRPTTRIYAPKCPTRLLYDDHPKNHSKIITFNNVIENETMKATSSMQTHKEESNIKDKITLKGTEHNHEPFIFPDVPDFPELILRDMESKRMPEELHKSGASYSMGSSMLRSAEPESFPKDAVGSSDVYSQNRSPQEKRFSEPARPRGDYVKHFETQLLPKDSKLPELVKALIREHSRNVATNRSKRPQRLNDMRYGMTSPNRMSYPRNRT